jgi:hypothetical protein
MERGKGQETALISRCDSHWRVDHCIGETRKVCHLLSLPHTNNHPR